MQQKKKQDLRATIKCYHGFHKVPFQKHLLLLLSENSLQKPLQIEILQHKKYAICFKSYLSLFAVVHFVLWMSTRLFSKLFHKILRIPIRHQTLSLHTWIGLSHWNHCPSLKLHAHGHILLNRKKTNGNTYSLQWLYMSCPVTMSFFHLMILLMPLFAGVNYYYISPSEHSPMILVQLMQK